MSAFGLLSSPIGFETARSRRVSLDALSDAALHDHFHALRDEGRGQLARAGVALETASYLIHLDARYEGQGYEVSIALPEHMDAVDIAYVQKAFEAEYRRIFGASIPDRPVEIVTWKIEAFGQVLGEGRAYKLHHAGVSGAAQKGERSAWNPDALRMELWPVFDRYALKEGHVIPGPALIEERESTCVVGPRDRLRVDERMNLVIEIGNDAW
jgi:N-methylhydantoinase A